MNNNNEYDGFLKFAILALAAYLFSKTADVLSFFAPVSLNLLVGWDVSMLYGMGNALLLEGVAVSIHFKRSLDRNGTAQFAKWAFLGISAACQVFDGFITTQTMEAQSDTIKAVFSYGVPLIPLFMLLMLFGVRDTGGGGEKKQFKGVKNYLPSLSKIWNGDDKPRSTPNKPPQEDKPKANPQNPPR